MDNDFPLGLRRALESGDCVLFVGAGVGLHIHGPDGKPLPDAPSLAEQLANYFSIEIGETRDLAKISQYIEIKKGRPELEAYLNSNPAIS